MDAERNKAIATQMLSIIATGGGSDKLAGLFAADVKFEIPGDEGALPWIGEKVGRAAAIDFFSRYPRSDRGSAFRRHGHRG